MFGHLAYSNLTFINDVRTSNEAYAYTFDIQTIFLEMEEKKMDNTNKNTPKPL